MPQFEVRYGLGGGFGGYGDWQPCFSCKTLQEAEDFAYECAIEEYESYSGMHGIISAEELSEENPYLTEEELEEVYRNEMESWLVYEAREVK